MKTNLICEQTIYYYTGTLFENFDKKVAIRNILPYVSEEIVADLNFNWFWAPRPPIWDCIYDVRRPQKFQIFLPPPPIVT